MEESASLLKIDQETLTKLSKDKLGQVNFSGAKLSELAVQVISYAVEKANNVFSVNLADNGFTSGVCRDLSRMLSVNQNLVFVDFSYNNIDNEGAEHLAAGLLKENKIKTLYLNSNAIGSMGISKLSISIARMNKLVSLDLSQNPIGDEGILCLLKAYKESSEESNLQSLYVDDCGIQEEGAMAAAALMSHIPSLVTLHIEDNPISDRGAHALLSMADVPGNKLFLTTGVANIEDSGTQKKLPPLELDPHFLKEARKYIPA
ncbi:hypothetical protein HOP50_11g63000 [Chloropicon primus]|uniref:Uncharacterized protein n=1 Tax=Chloropicon primus TaxID=1764295 RepID=A0A5B8MWC6_9CHLO|nr:hypothetical protein A3770_11p62780 [Chloropicon primus]UPR02973.1 hypothetical protein HOP50_11g63000 [Chloropicon primus]|eukprot:QDZ23760.1 hypothetical protein A3770_11p62780 [Chloropicon primus]